MTHGCIATIFSWDVFDNFKLGIFSVKSFVFILNFISRQFDELFLLLFEFCADFSGNLEFWMF